MSIYDSIAAVFQDVAREQRRSVLALSPDARLMELGLDSLSMAIIVARLEADLGVDPFSADEEVDIPSTFGEFVSLYQHALV